jgi:hypothetical protein
MFRFKTCSNFKKFEFKNLIFLPLSNFQKKTKKETRKILRKIENGQKSAQNHEIGIMKPAHGKPVVD